MKCIENIFIYYSLLNRTKKTYVLFRASVPLSLHMYQIIELTSVQYREEF